MNSIPTHKFQIQLQEVDHAGVMFFAHLFNHAHDAYAQMMQSMGFPLHRIIEAGEYHIPLVHAAADYLVPLRHGQKVEVRIQIESLGNSSFTLGYVFRTNDGVCARVSTRHVTISPDTGRPISIPDNLRQQLDVLCDCHAEARSPKMEINSIKTRTQRPNTEAGPWAGSTHE